MAYHAELVLILAALLDYGIGDPWGLWHPVQGMGWLISLYTQQAFRMFKSPIALRLTGIGLGVGLVLGIGLAGWLMVTVAKSVHPVVGLATELILLASCFAGRSLRDAAEEVIQSLQAGDLARSRSRLSRYVGRDTENISVPEVLRAVLETVTENATDGVMAPLFYAIVGAMIPAIGSVPLALSYKAASTLDSMVGYRETPYTHLGWFSAKLDDVLTWLPCRLVVLTISILSGRPRRIWQICWRDAPKDLSPNSGWSEAAYAAALGVQVGGTNWYGGVAKQKPLLGDANEAIALNHIFAALRLTRQCFVIWLVIAVSALWLGAQLD
ncbi:cobalamin biosynthesis protein [Phormidium sp. CLA17]|uniref:adenosylcobinamide-phosphate synthase CbiB n=1 Tax=Leptolyngbya sp. Cla-17 TaxID=2803751 RepID=UPI00149153D8|nr:adenosylcobinamide-phosphate synthase CbiB [Leptolyngbya sp. Cla-17]MBM0741269.1 cobalamin biosynthesis protein [Leptolyngbya sp. Cla-17]